MGGITKVTLIVLRHVQQLRRYFFEQFPAGLRFHNPGVDQLRCQDDGHTRVNLPYRSVRFRGGNAVAVLSVPQMKCGTGTAI